MNNGLREIAIRTDSSDAWENPLKKIRIATVDRCVMCGEIIPEGQQVCWKCKHKEEDG